MMLHTVLTVIQVLCCFAIIGLVLIQRGKGADAGAGFGAGASGTVFGARGASTALSRATAIFAAIFMLNSLTLAYVGSKASTEQPKGLLDVAAGVQRKAPGSTGNVPGNTPAPPSPSAPPATPAPTSGQQGGETSAAPAASAPAPAGTTSSQTGQALPAAAPAPAAPAAPTK
jgi:preprotein translocase subunit SecG